MITQITYARLHNLGNYENERFEVVVTVENGDVAAAFTEARIATDEARAQMIAVREERERQRRAEREEARQRASQEQQTTSIIHQDQDLEF